MWAEVVIILLGLLVNIENVNAKICSYSRYGYIRYYSCSSSQYCCGTSSCCYYSSSSGGFYSLWYFWFGVILFILICSGASGAYYRKRQRIIIRTAPAPGPVQVHQQSMVISATAASGYQSHPRPPPTYNQVMTAQGPNMGAAPYPTGYNMPPPAYNTTNGFNNGMPAPQY